MDLMIRNLEDTDLDKANEIASQAFGTPHNREEELKRYLSFQPDGWFCATVSGEPVGLVGAVDYGEFASIGMMVVLPAFQHLGIGRCLMEKVLCWLDEKRCPAAVLEATPAGQPLYTSLGFVPISRSHRYHYRGIVTHSIYTHPDIKRINPEYVERLESFDRRVFGADRSRVLKSCMDNYPDRIFLAINELREIVGYVVCSHSQIGPWVATDDQAARRLSEAALSLNYKEGPSLIIPEENQSGVKIIEEFGFGYSRSCTHMVRGLKESPVSREHVYGEASLALG